MTEEFKKQFFGSYYYRQGVYYSEIKDPSSIKDALTSYTITIKNYEIAIEQYEHVNSMFKLGKLYQDKYIHNQKKSVKYLRDAIKNQNISAIVYSAQLCLEKIEFLRENESEPKTVMKELTKKMIKILDKGVRLESSRAIFMLFQYYMENDELTKGKTYLILGISQDYCEEFENQLPCMYNAYFVLNKHKKLELCNNIKHNYKKIRHFASQLELSEKNETVQECSICYENNYPFKYEFCNHTCCVGCFISQAGKCHFRCNA